MVAAQCWVKWINSPGGFIPILGEPSTVPTFAVQTQKKLEPHHHIAPKGFRKVIFSRILYFSILFHSTFRSFRGRVLPKKHPAELVDEALLQVKDQHQNQRMVRRAGNDLAVTQRQGPVEIG